MARTPNVLFICVKNGGKSQMAAGLMRDLARGSVEVQSAGTKPGNALNALSAESLAELGIDINAEKPKPVTDSALLDADVVVTLGREAKVTVPDGTRYENWDTDEPSERGVEGIERMRLVRDDIRRRVQALHAELQAPIPAPETGPFHRRHSKARAGGQCSTQDQPAKHATSMSSLSVEAKLDSPQAST